MRLFLCYVFPPLAVLLCGKPFTAILTLILTVCGWAPGVKHALFVVNNHFQDGRVKRELGAINNPKWVKQVFPTQAPPPPPQYQIEPGHPLTWGYRKGRQLAMNGYAGRLMPQQPQVQQNDDPTTGANGTRFRRK